MALVQSSTTPLLPLNPPRVVRFEGTFDQNSMVSVLDAIRQTQIPLVIDLHAVSGFKDSALLSFAEALSSAEPGSVAVRGLGEHQLRILGYLGVQAVDCEPLSQ
jgi:hypothetical protein